MILYMWLIGGNAIGNLAESMSFVPSYLLLITVIVLITVNFSAGQNWYSIPISFGCLRKNAFLGHLCMDFLYIIESIAVYQIMLLVFHSNARSRIGLPLLLALLLSMEGISKLVGTAMIKWNKIVGFVICMIVLMAFLSAVFVIVDASAEEFGSGVFMQLYEFSLHWYVLLVGLAIYALTNIISYRFISSYEVK